MSHRRSKKSLRATATFSSKMYLAKRFSVSTRTIYRDIDALSSVEGIPVYINKGNGGGIHLLESYTLNRAIFSDRERENLLLAIKTLQATQYPELDIALEKMGAIFKNASNLRAYCRQRWEKRTFRITRLKNLEVMAETFEQKSLPKKEINESNDISELFIFVKLRFQVKVINRLYDYFDDSFLSANDDGSFTLEASLLDGEWLYSYILSFGRFVEILEPEHVRTTIVRRIRETLKIYEN
jgi:predicted DNA-binding transcriptional regulator YafY